MKNVISGLLLVLGASVAQAQASGPLVSEFFRNEPTAIAIAAGLTTSDINDFGLVLGTWDLGNTHTFAYRVVSAYRQLGYSFPFGLGAGTRPQEVVQNSFQAREGLPVTSTIDRELLLRLDFLLSQRETADAPLGAGFPLFSHMFDALLNEPPKTHLAAIYAVVFEKLPANLVVWTARNFEYSSIQMSAQILDFFSPDFRMCIGFYYPSLGASGCAALDPPLVSGWNDDFSVANTILHEYAHYVDGMLWGYIPESSSGAVGNTLSFYGISFDTSHEVRYNGFRFYVPRSGAMPNYVSGYARGLYDPVVPQAYTAYEDFAESFTAYVLHGYEFRELARSNFVLAAKYNWLRQNVFGGTEYDTGNRNFAAFYGPADRPFNVIDYGRIDPAFVWDYQVGLLDPGPVRCALLSRDSTNGISLSRAPCGPIPVVAAYKDSAVLDSSRGNPWKEIGTWSATPPAGSPTYLSDLRTWVGLKNGDDTGTRFDLRAELYQNGQLFASGSVRCIQGVIRDPEKASEITVPFGPLPAIAFSGTDTLSVKVLARIGTNPDGSKCPGHLSAAGLRLYFDSMSRPSGMENPQPE